MKTLKLLAIFLFFVLISCDKNTVYKEFDDGFTDNRWEKTDMRTYEFTITDESKQYDLMLDFSHVSGYQFQSVPVKLTITNPDKSILVENVGINVTDEQGNDLGECSGDICDLQQSVFQNKKLSAGNYSIALSNEFNNTYLPNVIGIGIRVKIAGSN